MIEANNTPGNDMTAYELLLSCPDSMTIRVRMALKAIAVGDWEDASYQLRNAASEGDTAWHERARELAREYETIAKVIAA